MEDQSMTARVPNFPKAKSDFINELVSAFRSRSKAIKHSVEKWAIDLSDDGAYERVDFDFATYQRNQVRLTAWDDGQLWFGACRGHSKNVGGWEFNFALHLHAKDAAPDQIVEAFEKSRALSDLPTMMKVWAAFEPEPDKSVG